MAALTGIRVEHLGPNRSGKILLNAIFAWLAYNQGRAVYCTCPEDEGRFDCILNFPHQHFDVSRPMEQDIYNCYLMTDESVEFLDARGSMKKTTKDFGYFGYQVLKRDIEWHYDTVLHENIDRRIRLSPEYQIKTERVPRDVQKSLVAVRISISSRWNVGARTMLLTEPWRFFPLYNDWVRVTPMEAV